MAHDMWHGKRCTSRLPLYPLPSPLLRHACMIRIVSIHSCLAAAGRRIVLVRDHAEPGTAVLRGHRPGARLLTHPRVKDLLCGRGAHSVFLQSSGAMTNCTHHRGSCRQCPDIDVFCPTSSICALCLDLCYGPSFESSINTRGALLPPRVKHTQQIRVVCECRSLTPSPATTWISSPTRSRMGGSRTRRVSWPPLPATPMVLATCRWRSRLPARRTPVSSLPRNSIVTILSLRKNVLVVMYCLVEHARGAWVTWRVAHA